MSRVDAARRRAAELASRESAGGAPRAEALKPLPLSDAARLTIEAFPVETGGSAPRGACEPVARALAQSAAVETRVGFEWPAIVGERPAPEPRVAEARPVVEPRIGGGRPALEARAADRPPDHTGSSSAHRGVGAVDSRLAHKFVGAADISPASREQYRRLAASLHNGRATSGLKVIMIASAVSGEGKTLTAANLALTFSESYHRRVLLVDADLRRPSIHELFLQKQAPRERIAHYDQRPLPVSEVTPRLSILTIGLPSEAPMAELTSDRMDRLLQDARDAYEWVVIDTPPVAVLPDASLLASKVDGIVLVVKAESTALPLVQQAVEAVGRKKMLGFVLNAARMRRPAEYREAYRYVTPSTAPTSPR